MTPGAPDLQPGHRGAPGAPADRESGDGLSSNQVEEAIAGKIFSHHNSQIHRNFETTEMITMSTRKNVISLSKFHETIFANYK